jgi:hypothetical protein
MVCEPDAGTGLGGPGVVWIEFGADGRFWTWVGTAEGAVVRDESQPATWEVYPFDEDEVTWGSAPEVVIASSGSEWHISPILLAEPPFLSFGYSGGGLLKGVPPVRETPLPATGPASATTMVAITGSLLFVGCAMFLLARLHRR